MIRGLGTTIACACLAGSMGVGLFFVKHEVKEQEARLAELNQEIHSNQEAIHVLKAEWSYLNDPARLRALSEKFLSMKVMGPAQIASLDTLPSAAPATAVARAPMAAPVAVAAARPVVPPPAPGPAARPALVPAKAPTAMAKASAPAKHDAKPAAVAAAKAPTAVAAAPRPVLVPGADTTPRLAAAPVPVPQPAPQTRAPGHPGRAIVVQSPALASTPALPGEVR